MLPQVPGPGGTTPSSPNESKKVINDYQATTIYILFKAQTMMTPVDVNQTKFVNRSQPGSIIPGMTTSRFIQTICAILLYISIQAPALSNEAARPDITNSQFGHKQVNCSACHSFDQSTIIGESGPSGVCISCHPFSELTGTIVSAVHQSIDNRCSSCHVIHVGPVDKSGSVPTSLPVRSSGFECLSCHNSNGTYENLSPGHQRAADFYHKGRGRLKDNTPSGTCMYCHSDQGTSGETISIMETAPAIHMVSSHPYGVPANGSGGSFVSSPGEVPVPLNDGMVECQTCHSLTSGRPFDLIPIASPYDLCLVCHPDKRPPSMSAEITRSKNQ